MTKNERFRVACLQAVWKSRGIGDSGERLQKLAEDLVAWGESENRDLDLARECVEAAIAFRTGGTRTGGLLTRTSELYDFAKSPGMCPRGTRGAPEASGVRET